MTCIYIAGPMTGLPGLNFPAFNAAEDSLKALGYEVESPTANQLATDVDYTEYLKAGLRQLLTCDAVALLPGWERSGGARLEVNVAATCGLEVKPVEVWINDRSAVRDGHLDHRRHRRRGARTGG